MGNRSEVFSGRNLLFPAGTLVLYATSAGIYAGGRTGCSKWERRAAPAGFIVAETGKQAGHIITIDVLKEFRRSGLGSQLMAAAEQRMRAAGCPAVILETAVDNATALAFYKRHQYFLVKTLPRYYATGVDAFVLKKDLLSNE